VSHLFENECLPAVASQPDQARAEVISFRVDDRERLAVVHLAEPQSVRGAAVEAEALTDVEAVGMADRGIGKGQILHGKLRTASGGSLML
jgi:hypothetical protein